MMCFFMIRGPPRFISTDTRFPYTALVRVVVVTRGQVFVPCSFVREWDQLVEVGVAVDDLLVVDADARCTHFQIFESSGAGDDGGGLRGAQLGFRWRRRRLCGGVWCVVPV